MPGRRKRGRAAGGSGFMSRLGGLSGLFSGGGGLGLLLKQYPVVSSLASLVLTKPVRSRLLASAKPILKWGGLGLVGWEAYRVWQQIKSSPDKPLAPDVPVDPDAETPEAGESGLTVRSNSFICHSSTPPLWAA